MKKVIMIIMIQRLEKSGLISNDDAKKLLAEISTHEQLEYSMSMSYNNSGM